MADETTKTPGIESEEKLLDIDLKVLEAVDLKLPPSYELEILALELLDHLGNYHRALVGVKSARNSGDHGRADQLYKLMAFSRLAVAILQSEHPGIKVIADEIGEVRAQQAKVQREALLKTE